MFPVAFKATKVRLTRILLQ